MPDSKDPANLQPCTLPTCPKLPQCIRHPVVSHPAVWRSRSAQNRVSFLTPYCPLPIESACALALQRQQASKNTPQSTGGTTAHCTAETQLAVQATCGASNLRSAEEPWHYLALGSCDREHAPGEACGKERLGRVVHEKNTLDIAGAVPFRQGMHSSRSIRDFGNDGRLYRGAIVNQRYQDLVVPNEARSPSVPAGTHALRLSCPDFFSFSPA